MRSFLLASMALGTCGASAGADFGVDRGKVDCVTSFPCDHSSASAKFYGSYQLLEAVDVQLVYFDAGRFKGGNTPPGPFPSGDLFVAKYDGAGTKQWTRQLGTAVDDVGTGIATDAQGNVYLSGHTAGNLDGNTSAGSVDAFIARYDSEGAKQWTREFGSTVDDFAYGIATDGQGNVYVTGSTAGGLDGNTNAGAYDVFVAKYDSAGIKQ